MNSQDNVRKFPKVIYDKLNQETEYDCQGSCSCKYIKNRTDFDITLYHNFEDRTKTNLPVLKTDHMSNKSKGWLL
jgi:hypothetical protein